MINHQYINSFSPRFEFQPELLRQHGEDRWEFPAGLGLGSPGGGGEQTVAEHPESLFNGIWKQRSALELARGLAVRARRRGWRCEGRVELKEGTVMRLLAAAATIGFVSFQVASGQTPLTLVGTIGLPRVEGRIDHLAVDTAAQRLFVAALGNNTVEVLDLKGSSHVKSLPGFREPQGIAVVPDAKLVAVANGQGEGVQFIDGSDYHPTRPVRLGDDSDNVRYDPNGKRLFVGYGGGALAAIDPADGKVLGEVKLSGHPESFQLERSGTRVFVNVPDTDQIAVIDRTAMKMIAAWRVVGAKSNFPMALDEANHRIFVGCRRPAKVLVYDTVTGKESGSFDIVGDTDDLFYDATRKRVYVSGGEGYVDVFQETEANPFARIAHVATAAGARTSLFVPDQGRLYLAVPHRGNQKAEIRVFETR